jgi:hypothetical protein
VQDVSHVSMVQKRRQQVQHHVTAVMKDKYGIEELEILNIDIDIK